MATPPKASERLRTSQEAAPNGEREPSHNERDPLACLGAELLRRAEESQPVLEIAWQELMASWGIRGEPMGVKSLRDLIQKECGTDPNDNAFSRELIKLREERGS